MQVSPDNIFRTTTSYTGIISNLFLFLLATFHYYTAGFGILQEHWHHGIHLSLILSMSFIFFSFQKKLEHIPWYDYVFCLLSFVCILYVPLNFQDLVFRVGNPTYADVFFGTTLILLILESVRRAIGNTLPIIILFFIAYALFGNHFPGVLKHTGNNWGDLVNHLYLTSQGIFGIPVQVVSTFVFHFVLFGILANEIGLGKFFIDFAYCIAGRQTGGTAKVSVLASAFFGTISGSSIANTVTTGSLTIPAMKSAGFKKHFAAAVEAASSTGGQITPPMMGAAAFIMAEMLEIPYLTIMCAAIIPALLHYIGVFTMIHLESKKLNIGRIAENKIPKFKELIKKQYLKLIPIVILITTLLLGYTPYKACFYGITSCLIIGFLQKENKLNFKKVYNSFILGSKFAISVGVVAAAVGIIIGVVTMTGTAFKISYTAAVLGNNFILYLQSVIPFIDVQSSKLFITGIIVSFCCIFLGAGIPTTATYIIVATIAAPVLSEIGVLPLVAHFFVFYYGVIADITPPVAVAAYAGAGIAGADPIKTGNTAFMLSTGKIIVPFFFLFSPSLLIFVDNFSFAEFITAFVTCITSIVLISISFIGYLNKKISIGSRIFFFILGIVLIFL